MAIISKFHKTGDQLAALLKTTGWLHGRKIILHTFILLGSYTKHIFVHKIYLCIRVTKFNNNSSAHCYLGLDCQPAKLVIIWAERRRKIIPKRNVFKICSITSKYAQSQHCKCIKMSRKEFKSTLSLSFFQDVLFKGIAKHSCHIHNFSCYLLTRDSALLQL